LSLIYLKNKIYNLIVQVDEIFKLNLNCFFKQIILLLFIQITNLHLYY